MTRLRLTLAVLLATVAVPALAEPKPSLDQRVDRVEKELRAVQRKVFPGGSPAFTEPEIAAPAPQAPPPGAGAGSSRLNDLTERVDALEKTVAQMTGQIEQNEHRLSVASEQAARDRAEFDTRLKALEASANPAPAVPVNNADLSPTVVRPAPGAAARPTRPGLPYTGAPFASTSSAPAPAPTRVSPARPDTKSPPPGADDDSPSAAPSTGDPAEDAYLAGVHLWETKKYPEARTALKAFLAKYPKHRRASYAQNLIGRSYLDEGSPANAAEAFAANYQTNPRGERAPDSLYYLGQSLMKLNKPTDACRVYREIDDAYGDKVSDSLKTRIAAARKEAKCK